MENPVPKNPGIRDLGIPGFGKILHPACWPNMRGTLPIEKKEKYGNFSQFGTYLLQGATKIQKNLHLHLNSGPMVGKQLMGKVAFVFFINFLLALFNVHDLSRQELNLRGRWCQRKVFTMQLSKSLKSNYAFVKPVEKVLFNEGTIKLCKKRTKVKICRKEIMAGYSKRSSQI